MATYLLANRRTDEFLGAFNADNPDGAVDVYARTKGYDSFNAYGAAFGCLPGEFVAVEWVVPETAGC